MIALIAAYTKNRVIGRDGKIPWNLEGEQKRFKELTTGNVVIMGRKTYEEIGRPLPGRDTIVLSKTAKYEGEHCKTAGSLKEALQMARGRDVYISGGEGVYREALDLADVLYITEIDAEIEGDTFFPEFDLGKYSKEIGGRQDGEIPYTYVTYTKKQIFKNT